MARLVICCLFYCVFINCSKAQNSLTLNYFKRINTWPGTQTIEGFAKGPNGFFFAGWIDTTSTVVTGCHGSNDNSDAMLIAVDDNINIKWAKCYGSTDNAFFQVGVNPNGSIWALGGFGVNDFDFPYPTDSPPGMATIVRFDTLGNPKWYREHGGTGEPDLLTLTSDGGALFLTQFNNVDGEIPFKYGSDPFNYNGWLCKLDSGGNMKWNIVLGGSGDQLVRQVKELEPNIYSVLIMTSSTDYMLAGINYDSTIYVPWLLKIDSGGHILSSKVLEDPVDISNWGNYFDFTFPDDSSILLCGIKNPLQGSYCYPGIGNGDFILVKTDTDLSFQWCALNGGTQTDALQYMCYINDSLVVAIGESGSTDDDLSYCSNFSNVLDSHEWIGLYNLNQRKKVWQQCLCGSGTDNVEGVLYDSTENAVYVLVNGNSTDGDFTGLALPNSDNMYLLKYTPVTTAIGEVSNNAPVIKVFPNPTSEYIDITCTNLPPGHQYYFTVYDLLGQTVANQLLPSISATLPCANWAPGLYIWQVSDESGNKLTEGKVVKE